MKRCELADAANICSVEAKTLKASTDKAGAPAIDAGVTYEITVSGDKRGYVDLVASRTGTFTLYYGDDDPVRVCDETSLCESEIDGCGDFHAAAQYALAAGEHYLIELARTAAKHPFRIHIVAPDEQTPPPPPTGALMLAAPVYYATTGDYVNDLTAGDLNGDGAPDIVVSNPDDAGGMLWVDIMRNDGMGAFTHAARVTTSAPIQTVVSDFDADGDADIAGVASDQMGPLPNFFLHDEGDFTFTKTTWTPTLQYQGALSSGDFDEDGIVDLVIPYVPEGLEQRSGFVILKMPDLAVLQEQDDFGGDARAAIAGDFNGDGHQDVLVGDVQRPVVHLWLGDGSGTVALDRDIAVPVQTGVQKLQPLDLDGNGYTDFIAFGQTSGAAVAVSSSAGFAIQALPDASKEAVAGDFDHDGRIDLIAGTPDIEYGAPVAFYQGTADGFVYRQDVPGAGSATFLQMVAADVNGDGLTDLVTNWGGGIGNPASISVFLGTR